MIKKAKEYKRKITVNNVEFLVNNGENLFAIPNESIDFLFSYLTL